MRTGPLYIDADDIQEMLAMCYYNVLKPKWMIILEKNMS